MTAQGSSHLAKSLQEWMAKPISKMSPHILAASAENLASAAALAGPGADAGLAASKALAAKAQSDPTGAKADFKNRPMDGCTSLMNMARVKAGFDPTKGMTGGNITAYQEYIAQVVKCPLFNLDMTDHQTIHRESDDYNELISKVTDTFEGIQAEDKAKIVQSIGNLVNAATSNSGTDEATDLFVQSVLYAGSGSQPVYAIYIYSSHVHLIDHTHKGHHNVQEDFDVQRTKMTFRVNDWPYFSDAVWDKQYSSVNDWLNNNTTPTGKLSKLVTCYQRDREKARK